ncbi:MAG: TonB-dependent receptor [Chitinophagaceae bacterium]
MKCVIASLAFLIACLYCVAQDNQTIPGLVTNKTNQPLQYANVLLLHAEDSSLVKTMLTDSAGAFKFTGVTYSSFRIMVTFVGYKDFMSDIIMVDSGNSIAAVNITLRQSEKTLSGVTVTATRPFLEQRIDKLIVNLNNSITSAGSTALEVLQKIPGVVIINDRVNLAGKSGVIIMINGKPSPYVDMESMLKDIPGINIERIEVITNPGARYEASGNAGIINLILKRQANLGLNGTFTGGGGYSYYDQKAVRTNDNSYYRYYSSLSLNFRTKKWNFFGNFDYLHRKVFEVNNYDRFIDQSQYKQINYYPYFYIFQTSYC